MILRILTFLFLGGAAGISLAGPADSSLSRITYLQSHPSQVTGPNCFNSVLYSTGLTHSLQYTSTEEFAFLMKNFCREKKGLVPAQAGDVVVFYDPNEILAHAALLVNDKEVFEKDSLFSQSSSKNETDPQAGYYLIRKLSDSLYGVKNSESIFGIRFQQKIYQCESSEKIKRVLGALQHKALQKQRELREKLATSLTTEGLLPLLKTLDISSLMKRGLGSNLANHYFAALTRSNIYQTYLLACGTSLEQVGECYNPSQHALLSEHERLFNEISLFEEKFLKN